MPDAYGCIHSKHDCIYKVKNKNFQYGSVHNSPVRLLCMVTKSSLQSWEIHPKPLLSLHRKGQLAGCSLGCRLYCCVSKLSSGRRLHEAETCSRLTNGSCAMSLNSNHICNRTHPASRCRYAETTGTNFQFQTPQLTFYHPQDGSNFRLQRVSDFRHRASVPRPTPRGFPRNHISPNRFRTPNSYTPRNITRRLELFYAQNCILHSGILNRRKLSWYKNHLLTDLLGVINDESCEILTGPSLETVPMEKHVNLKKGHKGFLFHV
jgi:hypothetical protein